MSFDNHQLIALSKKPLKLLSNRVRRSYTGGQLIDQWLGFDHPNDTNMPEEWVASIVEARNNDLVKDEGLSEVILGDGTTIKLIELIEKDNIAFLGAKHVARYGLNMALLTKILDSSVKLSIQVHPSKLYAKTVLNSDYGKTEAWYIVGGREINGEKPYVLIGFRPGVTKADWAKYFHEQDVAAMVNSLHKIYVSPGDVFLVEGGVPHAIGSGCFLIEIQEPTDYTMRVERKMNDGNELPDFLCHQGVGFDQMLECFNYQTLTREETIDRWKLQPVASTDEDGNQVINAISNEHTACFAMDVVKVKTKLTMSSDRFRVAIVISGNGSLFADEQKTVLKQGEMYFLPVNVTTVSLTSRDANVPLEIAFCYPPLN